ncbi:hypothetical protein [Bacillus cereus]|uniref:hypothetical protein n=1 Tax=Bacillus cereus TaxID=1396 RepID=UPI0009951925|nr:hypothetical protein [Bacillus cereus]OOZ84983.1 hypothetical protein BHL25_19135 [Bacillus cereus]
MKRKIGTAVVSLSVLGFGIFGVTHGNGGGIVKADSVGDHGGAPIYAHGNHGGAPSYTHGEGWSPSYAHGHTGGAPAYNKGDTWSPSFAHGNTGAPSYTHGHYPAPKLESHGDYGGAPANTEPGGGI